MDQPDEKSWCEMGFGKRTFLKPDDLETGRIETERFVGVRLT
jgi:hypothetical protein